MSSIKTKSISSEINDYELNGHPLSTRQIDSLAFHGHIDNNLLNFFTTHFLYFISSLPIDIHKVLPPNLKPWQKATRPK